MNTMDQYPTRDEFTARLEAAEARTEARFSEMNRSIDARLATVDARFLAVESKIDGLVTAVIQLSNDLQRLREENRATRLWVIGTVIIVGLGVATVLMADRANILSAVQATSAVIQAKPGPPSSSGK